MGSNSSRPKASKVGTASSGKRSKTKGRQDLATGIAVASYSNQGFEEGGTRVYSNDRSASGHIQTQVDHQRVPDQLHSRGEINIVHHSTSNKDYDENGNVNELSKLPFFFGTLGKTKAKRKKQAPKVPVTDIFSPTSSSHANIKANQSISTPTKTENSNIQIVNISADLADRVSRKPNVTSVPFPIPMGIRNASIPANWILADLPFSIPFHKNNEPYWSKVNQHLENVAFFCTQSPNNIVKLFINAVSSYSPNCFHYSNFQMLNRPDLSNMLATSLPVIVDHALQLPYLLEDAIPILNSEESKTLFLTRQLCCSLLANAFFCTFPNQSETKMPDFNFFRLYNDTNSERCEVKKEKLKCIISYFNQMHVASQSVKHQIVSYERRCIKNKTKWEKESKTLCDIRIEPGKKIEEAVNMLQIDFANKMVGGGVLNDGSVMEEIRFCTSPELIVSRMFTQMLGDNEVLVVTGSEQFTTYTGYSKTFTYKGPVKIKWEEKPVDNFGRTYPQLVLMDATSFKKSDPWKQFQQRYIDRELHKCKVAFVHGRAAISPIATGNWGCGAFNGDTRLKFLIQWMAASKQDRPFLLYHINGNQQQEQELKDICNFVRQRNIQIGQLYSVVVDFILDPNKQQNRITNLFGYIKYRFSE